MLLDISFLALVLKNSDVMFSRDYRGKKKCQMNTEELLIQFLFYFYRDRNFPPF